MIKHPQFIKYNNRLLLAEVTRIQGAIKDINGPYQIVGMENDFDSLALCQELISTLHKALHEHTILDFSDLPENLKEKIAGTSNTKHGDGVDK